MTEDDTEIVVDLYETLTSDLLKINAEVGVL